MNDALQAFLDSSDPKYLIFTQIQPMPFLTLVSQLPFQTNQIQILKNHLQQNLPPGLMQQLLQFNQQIGLTADSYKARRFALIFDPQKQLVFERLVDRTLTVRQAALQCAVAQNFLQDDILAQRFVDVLVQTSKTDDLIGAMDLNLVSPVIINYLKTAGSCPAAAEKLAEIDQISPFESFLQEGDAYLIKYFQKVINAPNASLIDFLNAYVEREFELLPCAINSIRHSKNHQIVNFLERKISDLNLNRNVLAGALNQINTDDSFGGISVDIFAGNQLDLGVLFKSNKDNQSLQNTQQNLAIFTLLIQEIQRNIHGNLQLANDIIVNYLNRTDSFALGKHITMLDFVFNCMAQSSQLHDENLEDVSAFVKQIDRQISQFYVSCKTSFSTDSDFYFQIVSISTGIVNQIAFFAPHEELLGVVLHCRNTLGKLATMIFGQLFSLEIRAEIGFLRSVYVYTILGANISLLTPSIKDYQFDVIRKWAEQLVGQVNIYSEDTFLKSIVYGEQEPEQNAALIAFTVENVVDLVNILLQFDNKFDMDALMVQIARLVYHVMNSNTLRGCVDCQSLIFTYFQPILGRLFELASFTSNFLHFGVLLGIIVLNVPQGERFVIFLFDQLLTQGADYLIVTEILVGVLAVNECYKFGEEIGCTEIVNKCSKINVLPVIFLCYRQSKQVERSIEKLITLGISVLPQEQRSACQIQMRKLECDIEVDAGTEDAGQGFRAEYIKKLGKLCSRPAGLIDRIYE
ncbi:hypothetical protein SS50377_23897 [Spironucleus salmonicida]|uniref:Uncharacterized protein n=1 Tax=Spironucleus salmonicida TaxID=348837 RepID=V6LX61_9EUKA|nr:hypothetical protein SS50377_23897 [Spironucleus salmonicida]|eukprot:EST48301.1 Hypothetical protein SS50377_11500 [Spironucleus salmonicida]